eukprot:scaffold102_cov340-Pavlova_lutheri.AAC.16
MHRRSLDASDAKRALVAVAEEQDGVEVLLVDLDDTLYREPKVAEHVRDYIGAYMERKLGIPARDMPGLRMQLYMKHGTTAAGLAAHGYDIDWDDWHSHVHGQLPYEKVIQRDERLRAVLERIPAKKYVFTNADRQHADTVLQQLGIENCFHGIICFESIQENFKELLKTAAVAAGMLGGAKVVCKPSKLAFELALRQAGNPDPRKCLFIDDSPKNVEAAHRLGMKTCLVGQRGSESPSLKTIDSMHDILDAFPSLKQ